MKVKFSFNTYYSETRVSVTLDSVGYDIELIWLDVEELWIASVYQNGRAVTEGRVVVVDMDLFGNIPNVGKLTFEGEKPNRNNIGVDCFLFYYEVSNV
uniref:Cyanophage baseplate Pam3 plug gp18 domain-containing protein n=7 Tax=Vibrionaceae TaxID=641 RepID=A0A0H3ZWW5_9VIBR|nr:hypothetical protein [Vibrio splendidus]AKN36658.1 hypothetical protein [Vibrio sp. FF_482]AKN37833.1 hypothetical protein [Vibrio tasmaniensis]AKN38742.1 hypothetical protein [Enterovibrio norvegicus]AKN38958.1 hypothetical protein [Aliivibrio fischeri]AKN39131.1 hypothetical protein [Vibrio kanaloae]AKN39951.1 hypothetical protein [Vibrio sp. FF_307]